MNDLAVAAIQMDLAWEDRAENFRRASRWASLAAEGGAQLVVLPEMFATGFSMNPGVVAEPVDGPTPTFLRSLAVDLGVAVVGGYVREMGPGFAVNVALTVDRDGATLAEYHKVHLASLLGEHEAHAAGDGPRPFTLDGAGMACFVCYDLRFPELFRLVAEDAAVVIVIASWPDARQSHWDALLPARAIENQMFVVGVNRVGSGGGLDFAGGTTIVDPLGRVLAAGGDEEGVVSAVLDLEQVAEVRRQLPFLRDRRV